MRRGADLADLAIGREAALVAAMLGLVLAAVGWRAFRALAPLLTLLLLLVPAGDVLIPPLKWLTVKMITGAAALAGVPHAFDGNVIYVGAARYVVIDACAGLPVVLACTFIALTFGLLACRSAWKVAGFALMGAAAGIAANGLRAVFIVGVDFVQGTQMALAAHGYYQWTTFALALAALFAALAGVKPESGEATTRAPAMPADGTGGRCFIAASCAALLAASIPLIAPSPIDDGSTAGTARSPAVRLPLQVGQWARDGQSHDWQPAPRIRIGHDAGRYVERGREIAVFVATSDTPGRKVTGYSIDLVGPGAWREGKRDGLPGCVTDRCEKVQVLELLRRGSPDVRRVYYVYAIDGALMGSALALQIRLAWDRLLGVPSTAGILALAHERGAALRSEEVVDMLHRLAALTVEGPASDLREP